MVFVEAFARVRTSYPLSRASFRVTLVGSVPAEWDDLEAALGRAGGSLTFAVKRQPSATTASFPLEAIHAIVFTPTSRARMTATDVDAVRSATEPGTCRIYLLVPPDSSAPRGASPLDEFIQRTPMHDPDAVAGQIIAFFREADDLNRRSTLLGLRDRTCLWAYQFLKFLWPCSYVFAALHIVNTAAVLAGRGPWPGVLAKSYVVPAATFFGAFFVIHCIFVLGRNALFGIRIVKRLDLGFAGSAGASVVAAAATSHSIAAVDQSMARIFASAVLALGAYVYYMYARRVRVECTSLSALQAAMANGRRRTEVLNAVGRQPLPSSAFSLLPCRSRSLFISYMHGSEWSRQTAALIRSWTTEHGFDVFLDRSSIPSGSRWREFLLRGVSESGWFIAVLDGDVAVTEWVLAESAYAALLRKSIGRPRILLVARDTDGLATLQRGPFGVVYMDLFQLPPDRCVGAGALSAEGGELSERLIMRAMERVRPICLLH